MGWIVINAALNYNKFCITGNNLVLNCIESESGLNCTKLGLYVNKSSPTEHFFIGHLLQIASMGVLVLTSAK